MNFQITVDTDYGISRRSTHPDWEHEHHPHPDHDHIAHPADPATVTPAGSAPLTPHEYTVVVVPPKAA